MPRKRNPMTNNKEDWARKQSEETLELIATVLVASKFEYGEDARGELERVFIEIDQRGYERGMENGKKRFVSALRLYSGFTVKEIESLADQQFSNIAKKDTFRC